MTKKCPRLSCNRPRHSRSRWVGAAIAIVGVHISGVAIGMMKWEETREPPAMPPAVMIDMLPPAAPPPPQKQPDPEIDIPDAELPPEPELSEFLPPPPLDVEPAVEMAPKVEKKKEETEKVAEKPKEKPKKKEEQKKKEDKKVTKKPEPEPTKIVPPPAHDKTFKTASDAPSTTQQEVETPGKQAAATAGGGQSAAADGQSAAQTAAATAAKASWNSLVLAHLQKHQKYPRAAKRRNQTGVATVKFTVDRAGYVKEVILVSSSGVGSLDEEALETVRRAEPLPQVPAEMAGSAFTRDIPMQFKLTGQ